MASELLIPVGRLRVSDTVPDAHLLQDSNWPLGKDLSHQCLSKDSFNGSKMKDFGEIYHILGIRVRRDRQSRTLTLNQTVYINTFISK